MKSSHHREESIAMIIEDSFAPEHGKGAWPWFETVCMFLPSLRRLGARSVKSHQRMFQQRSELFYDS